MTLFVHANFAESQLAKKVASGDTTLYINDGSLFPTLGVGEAFKLVLFDGVNKEILECTARSGETLTVTRAAEGTSASAFAAGTIVRNTLTADVLNGFLSSRMADGSAATPGQYFTNDPDTGFYRVGANQLGIAAGGVASARFTSTGINSTAIGATTPAAGTFTTLVSASYAPVNGGAAPNTGINSPTAGTLLFWTDGDPALSIDAAQTITMAGALGIAGNLIVNTTAFTVASNTGDGSFGRDLAVGRNAAITGTLSAGATTLGALSSGAALVTPAVNTNAIKVTGYSLTGSDTHALMDLTGTWNTSGQALGIALNITDTASASNSLLLDLLVGGVPKFYVLKDGSFSATGDGAIAGALGVTGNATIGGTLGITGVLTGIGSGLTALNASNLASGTVPVARLGTGSVGSGLKFLADDSTWKTLADRVLFLCQFNGATQVLASNSINVSSVTRNAAGRFTINFTTAVPHANYHVSGSCNASASDVEYYGMCYSVVSPVKTTTAVKVAFGEDGNLTDSAIITVMGVG